MLNLFPTMWLSLFAHALLRVILGSVLLYLGYQHLIKNEKLLQAAIHKHCPRLASFSVWTLGIVETVTGGMFLVGAYTQVAAIIGVLLSIKMLILKRHLTHPSIPQPLFYLLVLSASVSLFITGAGMLAFDLPF